MSFRALSRRAKRAFFDGIQSTSLPLTICGKMTHTGTDMRSKGEAFGEISILEEILRN